MNADIARQQVARGAAALDEIEPGWWKKVRMNRLSLSVGIFSLDPFLDDLYPSCGCVLAQLDYARNGYHGDYGRGLKWFRREARRRRLNAGEVSNGFHVARRDLGRPENWDRLTEFWRMEIRSRRRAARSGR